MLHHHDDTTFTIVFIWIVFLLAVCLATMRVFWEALYCVLGEQRMRQVLLGRSSNIHSSHNETEQVRLERRRKAIEAALVYSTDATIQATDNAVVDTETRTTAGIGALPAIQQDGYCGICLESFSGSPHQSETDTNDKDNKRERDDVEKGRTMIVASSPNKHCMHAFCKECIVDWLLKHDTCPICRTQYLDEHLLENYQPDDDQHIGVTNGATVDDNNEVLEGQIVGSGGDEHHDDDAGDVRISAEAMVQVPQEVQVTDSLGHNEQTEMSKYSDEDMEKDHEGQNGIAPKNNKESNAV